MSLKPQAQLLPHTTAPLASRINHPPVPSTSSTSIPSTSSSPSEQEQAIIQDLLYTLIGCEGENITFSSSYDPLIDPHVLTHISFTIKEWIDLSIKRIANRILSLSENYIFLQAFVSIHSRMEYGLVFHAFSSSVRSHLDTHLDLIGGLEEYVNTNKNTFTLQQFYLRLLSHSTRIQHIRVLCEELWKLNVIQKKDDDEDESSDDDLEILLGNIEGKNKSRHPQILGIITRHADRLAGDPEAYSLLRSLLNESSKPYMAMLNSWLHHGSIRDPYGEFMIREEKMIDKELLKEDYTDEYWEKRYTIRSNHNDEDAVPPQLRHVQDKVLIAGKYLNVIREGGIPIPYKDTSTIPLTFDDPRFLANINDAYSHANQSLLQLLITTHDLPARLASLKHYFFLSQSDFFTNFLDVAAHELKKPAKQVSVSKVQTLLDMILRSPGSITASEPFKEDVKVEFNDMALIDWLMKIVSVTGQAEDEVASVEEKSRLDKDKDKDKDKEEKTINGYSTFQFDYNMPFPLSLVVSRKAILRYQLLFRHILSLKYMEQQLSSTWAIHAKLPQWRIRSQHRQIEVWKGRVWALRARMLGFIQQLAYFCTSEIIEPNWQNMMSKLGKCTTVDQLMNEHSDFLDTCLKECMLTSEKLLRLQSRMMNTCKVFTDYASTFSRYLAASDPNFADPSAPSELDPQKMKKLDDFLGKYEDNFKKHLKIFLNGLNYHAATETVALIGLVIRLDWSRDIDWGGRD